MAVAPTPVAAAPDAPDRAQRATFSARATAFFDWIKNTFVAGVNALASVTYSNAIEAATQATAAAASASAASGSVAAAQSSAAQAALYGGAAAHNPATNYAVGAVVKSNVNYAPYKCRAAGIDASDPSANADKWKPAALEIDTGYPIIRPSLTLDFANSQIFDPRITFTRASAATRVNSMGLIETVASGVPRLTYNAVTGACEGYLVEEQRTNLLTYSEQFDNTANWSTTRSSVTPNVIVAPDGTLTADKLVESTDTSVDHYLYCRADVTAGTAYTLSLYIKAAERTNVALRFRANNAAFADSNAFFNIGTGVITNSAQVDSATITHVGNGWYRISATKTATSTALATVSITLVSTGTTVDYTGDGTSGLNIWGAQLEAGAFPTTYIPSTVTHTGRASTATFIGSNGLIQTAASGAARYNYNPANLSVAPALLLEAASTNLLLQSETFDNASWSKSRATVTANAAVSPDGTVDADKLVEDATASNSHYAAQSFSATSGTTYTYSFFAKQAERLRVGILAFNTNSVFTNSTAVFNLSSGAVTRQDAGFTSASIANTGNGWYRVSVSIVAAATATGSIGIMLADADTSVTYTGNGASGLFIWGAQLEAGSYPTSYIPTTASQVTRAADTSTSAATTRAADVAVMTGADFSGWYRQDEGTFVVSGKRSQPVPAAQYPRLLQVGTSAANTMAVLFGGGSWLYAFSSFGGAEVFNTGAARTETVDNQAAMAYKYNDYALSVSGGSAAADTTGGVPAVDRLAVGLDYGSGGFFNGTIRDITYYSRRLTNAELQTLSAQ